MPVKLTMRTSHDVTIVEISGMLISTNGLMVLRKQLSDVLRAGSRKIIVEMSGVHYMDSSCLGELVAFVIAASGRATVKLSNLTEHARSILQACVLHTVFDIYEDEASAFRSFSTGRSPDPGSESSEPRSEYFLG